MIRKFISRILGRKSPGLPGEPAIIAASKHGIRREHISNGSRRTVETLQEHGYKAYVVGGAVRDLLAGITPNDYDVATSATPEQVRSCFRRSRIIGRRFQIVHVLMGAETVEVTTFRGHHEQQHGGNGETGGAREHASGEAEVLEGLLQPHPAALLPRLLLDPRDITEFPLRSEVRFLV